LEEWKTVPFEFGTASPMQVLLSHAASIPSLLEKVDRWTQVPCEATQSTVNQAYGAFKQVLANLQQWEESQKEQRNGPLYWPKSMGGKDGPYSTSGGMFDISLWFLDIPVANAFTHFWTFQIICLVHIAKLESQFSDWASFGALTIDESLPRSIYEAEYISELSTKICQSMEYQLQDEMRLYGPASVLFPLRTAREIFDVDMHRNHQQIGWCQRIEDQLRIKGIDILS
jgi:hypothetical protein